MQYSLYVDRIFFLHFIMNLLLLLLTAKLASCQTDWKRLLGAAAAGALFFLAILLIPAGKIPGVKVLKNAASMIAGLAALQLAFGFRKWESMFRAAFFYVLSASVLGGILGAGCGRGTPLSLVKILIPASFSAMCLLGLIGRERRRNKNLLWQVEMKAGNRRAAGTALMDSGNSLYDPFTGQPVCLVEKEVAEMLGLLQKPEKIHIIPYHSIGKQHGLLQAEAVEEMYLEKDGQERRIKQVMLAVSPQKLSAAGRYQLILHPALLEEKKGENHDIESSDAGENAV